MKALQGDVCARVLLPLSKYILYSQLCFYYECERQSSKALQSFQCLLVLGARLKGDVCVRACVRACLRLLVL